MSVEDDDLFPAAETENEEVAETPEPDDGEEAPAPESETPEPEPEKTVPLAALQSARDEAKTLKAKLAELDQLKAQFAAMQAGPQRQLTEQEAILHHLRAAATQEALATMSEMNAREKNGSDVVEEAFEAAKQMGVLDTFKGRKDGWGDLVRWHKSQKVASEIGSDPDGYKQRLEQEIRQKILAEQAAQSVKPSRGPSLAAQPNLGSRESAEWSGPTSLEDILKG